uniref:Uncharacterized protein n=1 Tax=Anguilla anguilla TaxID=7936 RepID=A0A0E9T5J8_ANGAN
MSDTYWIDPDGSGPLGPFRVNCNMTGKGLVIKQINDVQYVCFCSILGCPSFRRATIRIKFQIMGAIITSWTSTSHLGGFPVYYQKMQFMFFYSRTNEFKLCT